MLNYVKTVCCYKKNKFCEVTVPWTQLLFPYSQIVLRANEWLVYNPEVRVAACESVMGFSAQSHGFNPDRVVGTRSKIGSESTFFIRFLRYTSSRVNYQQNKVWICFPLFSMSLLISSSLTGIFTGTMF